MSKSELKEFAFPTEQDVRNGSSASTSTPRELSNSQVLSQSELAKTLEPQTNAEKLPQVLLISEADFKVSTESSLFCLSIENPFRFALVRFIAHPGFRYFILGAILLNSVMLALDQPAVDNPDELDLTLLIFEYIFTIAFAAEMVVKILALGFAFHKDAYLRSGWNVMDCIIVIVGCVSLAGLGDNYSAVRVLRVLRPLRTISRVKKLKHLIAGLFRAMAMVLDNIILLCFILLLFAIASVHLWMGKLAYRCYVPEFPNATEEQRLLYGNLSVPFLIENDENFCGGIHTCGMIAPNVTSSCESHRDQFYKRNMNYDNTLTASLLILKVIVLDNWPDDVTDIVNATGWWSTIFFVVLTLVGSFLCINLFLAILTQAYSTHGTNDEDEEGVGGGFERKRRSTLTMSHLSDCGIQVDEHKIDLAFLMTDEEIEASGLLIQSSSIYFSKEGKESDGLVSFTPMNTQLESSLNTQDKSFDLKDPPKQQMPRQSVIVKFETPETEGLSPATRALSENKTTNDERRTSRSRSPARITFVDAMRTPNNAPLDAPSSPSPKPDSLSPCLQNEKTDSHEKSGQREDFMQEFAGEDDDEMRKMMQASDEDIWQFALGEVYDFGEEGDQRSEWRRKLGDFAESTPVNVFMMILTLVNVLTLAIDHWGIDPTLEFWLGVVSMVCTGFFAIHISIKLIAFGIKLTFSKGMNIFDFLLVLLSIPDIIMSGGGASGFSVIRAFRMIRVLRLLRGSKSLQALVQTILDSATSVAYLSLLILLFLYVFSIMGMQVFGMSFSEGERIDERTRFGTLWEALLVCFIVMTGEDWTNRMLIGMRGGTQDEATSIIFFTVLYMVGNYILINLFVAIIMDKLAEKMEELDEGDELIPPVLLLPQWDPQANKEHREIAAERERKEEAARDPAIVVVTTGEDDMPELVTSGEGDLPSGTQSLPTEHPDSNLNNAFIDEQVNEHTTCGSRAKRLCDIITYVRPIKVIDKSLFIFSPENCFRKALLTILGSFIFDMAISFCVLANMVFLFFESAHNSAETQYVLDMANNVFTGIFVIEMFVKIIAFGAFVPGKEEDPCVKHPHQPAYFRDIWNCVDAIINVFSICAIFYSLFRASRSLRTIRLMIRNEKTRIIIMAMLQVIPHVLQGLIFVVFMFLVFGIMGVQLFKGEFYRCTDLSIIPQEDCVGTFLESTPGPFGPIMQNRTRTWEREYYHFNHLGASVLSLFVVAVGDGWSYIMFNGMDTSTPGRALHKNAEPWMCLFFVVVFICCNFFAFNMIVGILINYFGKMKKLNDGSALLTPLQRVYVKARSIIDNALFNDDLVALDFRVSQAIGAMLRYRRPNSSPHSLPIFDMCMLFVIVVNTAFIAVTHYGMDAWVAEMIDMVSHVCLAIFTLEVILKMTAYGPKQYCSLAWNVFDLSIVALGLASLYFTSYRFLSFMRVLRIMKLVKGTSIEKLLGNIIRSFNSFVNVFLLLLLAFFIYAVAGVILWGRVKYNGALTPSNNFETVPNAMLLLYQICTTEGWSDIMLACSIEPPDCSNDPEIDNCGNQPASISFFCSFMVICAYTVLQLFVAVVVEIFTDEVNESDPVVKAFFDLKCVWADIFGIGSNVVHMEEFVQNVHRLPPLLTGLPKDANTSELIRSLAALSIPIDSSFRVIYRDVVYAMAWRKYVVDARSVTIFLNDTIFGFVSSSFTVGQAYATEVIQKRWRKHQLERQQHDLRELGLLGKNTGEKSRRSSGQELPFTAMNLMTSPSIALNDMDEAMMFHGGHHRGIDVRSTKYHASGASSPKSAAHLNAGNPLGGRNSINSISSTSSSEVPPAGTSRLPGSRMYMFMETSSVSDDDDKPTPGD